jgi:hypothetical protein
MMRRAVLAVVVSSILAVGLGVAAAPPGELPIPLAPVIALLSRMANLPGIDRGTLGVALGQFMDGLVAYLETQGVPTRALGEIKTRFAWALNAFLNAGATAAAFGEDVARLARELRALADQGGVRGLPAALLERIGIATWAVDALRENARELTGMEVADLARQIAGQALARAWSAAAAPAGPSPVAGPPAFAGPPPFARPPTEEELPPRRRR